jgi:sugar phosphate isomerase/epimerase
MNDVDARLPRVAAHTYAYRDQPLEVALEAIARLGFSAAEIWVGHAADGTERVVKALADFGVEAIAVSAGGFYDELAPSASRSFELAQAIGAEIVVACVVPAALARLSGLVPPGITLCVENHWDQPTRRPRDILNLLAGTSARFQACLDTGHSILAGVRSDRFAAQLGPSLAHIHLKDARRPSTTDILLGPRLRKKLLPRPQPVAAGTGDLDVGRLVTELERIGYRGWITVEDEGADVASALAVLKGALLNPASLAAERQS